MACIKPEELDWNVRRVVAVSDKWGAPGQIYGLRIADTEGFKDASIVFTEDHTLHCCGMPESDHFLPVSDSPIAAGDDVVCVDASHSDGVGAGKSYRVTTVKGDLIAFSGNYRAMNKDRFVKVKTLAPEVKQEAVEPEPNFDYQSAPPTKHEPANCLTRVGREFWMVKGFGPTQYEHESLDSAMIEAERLARAHPGVPFTVLGPVSIFFNGMARIDRDFDDGLPF